jgi:hypothetical protein
MSGKFTFRRASSASQLTKLKLEAVWMLAYFFPREGEQVAICVISVLESTVVPSTA